MSLALFEKQFDDVDLELRCLGEWDAIWRRRARCRLPNAEGGSLPYRHNLGDGCFTIEHVDGLASAIRTCLMAYYDQKWSFQQWRGRGVCC